LINVLSSRLEWFKSID